MSGYNIFNLSEMLDNLEEEKVVSIIETFSCPLNRDVEHFLHHTAIEFSRQGIARTFLIIASI